VFQRLHVMQNLGSDHDVIDIGFELDGVQIGLLVHDQTL
jgi:hypothetical protein